MAFTVEILEKTLAGNGEVTEEIKQMAANLVKLHEDDIVGLKGTNAELKKEKQELKDKWNADIEKFALTEKGFQEKLKKAEDEIASGGDKSREEYWKAQNLQLEQGYMAQLAIKDKAIADKDSKLVDFETKFSRINQETAFMDALRKTKADPVAYDALKTLILGDGSRFALHDTPNGPMYWANDGSGETFENRLNNYLNSDVGKRFVKFDSYGSGAEGSAKTGMNYTGSNPFKKETFNLHEQSRLYREEPEMYKLLKSQAEQ